MVKKTFIVIILLAQWVASAQEILLPLECMPIKKQLLVKQSEASVALPFFDDFASLGLSSTLWCTTGGVTVGQDVSPLAPTIGVATLDAIGSDGLLYPSANTQGFYADTLCSRPIRLDSLSVGDSVVFSFYWLPGGGFGNLWERVGDTPDQNDSLYLDFYSPVDSSWTTVWSVGGIDVDSLIAHTGNSWQYVSIALTNPIWFDSTFRFRFRNTASLEDSPKAGKSGNCDYWHLDYIVLDKNRNTTTSGLSHDVAFAAPAPSMLNHYRAMPFRQYSADDMAANLSLTITNLYNSTLASHYTYQVIGSDGTPVSSYDGGFENIDPHYPDGGYQTVSTHATPPVESAFPEMNASTTYTVLHIVKEGTSGDEFPNNDTVRYTQVFDNYYAYDDGTSENGYGLTSTASQLYLAYRFDLNQTDTLTAVDIFFNSTLDGQNETIPFYITVWNQEDGHPGTEIYRDEARRYPQAGSFHRYILEHPVILDNTIYVGFVQLGNNFINLGFDRSLNTSDRIWYLTGTEWQHSILSGSLLLRPCFGTAAMAGLDDVQHEHAQLAVSPNPTSSLLHIEHLQPGSLIELFNSHGHRCLSSNATPIDVRPLPSGLYLLRVTTPQGESNIIKIIIQH